MSIFRLQNTKQSKSANSNSVIISTSELPEMRRISAQKRRSTLSMHSRRSRRSISSNRSRRSSYFEKIRVCDDTHDISVHPSYTSFKVPFHIQCKARYAAARQEMENQFQHEKEQLLKMMDTAYEATRYMRHIAITTLWPPLHNRIELQNTRRRFFRLSRKERERLDFIMNNKIE